MEAALNGQKIFDKKVCFKIARRGRKIKQTGTLRAKSRQLLEEKLSGIKDYMDGYPYTLVTDDGSQFQNARIDAFKWRYKLPDRRGFALEYEIVYTLLSRRSL